jgi:CheY-like chemotaxis protein
MKQKEAKDYERVIGKRNILVVDDVHLVLKVAVEVLKNANFNVLQADSGAKAVELAKNHAGKIDLLLSDVQMPGMTGPDLGDTLKKARPDMHVMFMSGFTGGNLLASAQLRLVFYRKTVRHGEAARNGERRTPHTEQISEQSPVRHPQRHRPGKESRSGTDAITRRWQVIRSSHCHRATSF